ncbi:MAG: HupE/UreJ family protein [Polyangiales bacterium]
MTLARVTALLSLLVVAGVPAGASAHLGSTKYLRVERTDRGAHVQVDIEALDASMELGLGEDVDVAAIMQRREQVTAWLAEGLAVRQRGRACDASAGELRSVRRDERPFLSLEIDYRCSRPGGTLVLRDDTVFPDDPQHEAIVRLAFPGEEVDAVVLRAGDREAELGEPPGWSHLAGVFLWEGVLHLVTGYDHVLFLLSLILASGFVAVRRGLRIALRDVAILVTAFTIGHSVTLIAAALGVVVLPSQLVESVIAGSIVAVALLNIVRPEARGPMPWLAFGFGLIHGFGFSSVLAELGLPRERTVLALLAFNVGIELAQLAFVAVLLGPIAWAAQLNGYRNVVVRGGSAVIGLLAGVWLIERVLGV